MKSKVYPPTYFFLFLLAVVAVHYLLPLKHLLPLWARLIGLAPIAFGIVLNLWTDSLFKKRETTVKPYEQPSSLLVAGPFRLSRHPMYLGMVAILLGEAMLFGSLSALLLPLVFAVLMEWLFIPYEERNMQAQFGEEYLAYKKKVRRWI